MITPIEPLLPVLRPEEPEAAQSGGVPFGDIFRSAVQEVVRTDAERTEAEYLLATGQMDNPILSSIAATKNQLAVELLVQLRNKALDAYSEITRISL